jgi:hypothetical protein
MSNDPYAHYRDFSGAWNEALERVVDFMLGQHNELVVEASDALRAAASARSTMECEVHEDEIGLPNDLIDAATKEVLAILDRMETEAAERRARELADYWAKVASPV